MASRVYPTLPDGSHPGDSALADAVVFQRANQVSIGDIAMGLLLASATAIKVVIDYANSVVYAYPADTDATGMLGSGMKLVTTITPDVASKRGTPMTAADGDDVSASDLLTQYIADLRAPIAAVKPTKTLATLLSAIEEARYHTGPEGVVTISAERPIVVIDQASGGHVDVYAGGTDFTAASGALGIVKAGLPDTSATERLAWE